MKSSSCTYPGNMLAHCNVTGGKDLPAVAGLLRHHAGVRVTRMVHEPDPGEEGDAPRLFAPLCRLECVALQHGPTIEPRIFGHPKGLLLCPLGNNHVVRPRASGVADE